MGQQAGSSQIGQLGQFVAAGEEIQEPDIVRFPGDCHQSRAHRMKVTLQPVDDAHPFPHQLFAPSCGAFELVVFNGCRRDFVERVFCQRQVLGQAEQFEYPARIDGIGLGRCREYFLVAGEFEVIDAVQAVTVPENLSVQRARPAVIAFHGNGYRQLMAFFKAFDMVKKFLEAACIVTNIELIQQLAVRQPDCHPVTGAADIYCNSY